MLRWFVPKTKTIPMRKALWQCVQFLWLTMAASRCYVTRTTAFMPAISFTLTQSQNNPTHSLGSRSLFSSSSTSSTLTYLEAASTNFIWETTLDGISADKCNSTTIIGKKASVESLLPQLLEPLGLAEATPSSISKAMVQALDEKKGGGPSSTMLVLTTNNDNEAVHRLVVAGLPSKFSRHNHPMGVDILTRKAGNAAKGDHSRLVVLTDDYAIGPLGLAIAKAYPLFSQKSNNSSGTEKNLHITFVKSDGNVVDDPNANYPVQIAARGVQLAARLVDSHPDLLTTTQFSKEVKALVEEHSPKVKMTEIIGTDLAAKGYGGLYAVGKGANCPPRLIILEYDGTTEDTETNETVALVGKGIVYDTGGLSLKSRAGMSGMKHDMGGAAGMLGGFFSAVALGVSKKVTCILCLAENAIGPDAFRNDDILKMYSGKTVEVNNCDAEGRLVLGDGVAYATQHIENLDLVVDMATLTGAQLVATGKKHAGILCNNPEIEDRAMQAGLHSGDLCYPLLYAPELLMDEFKSEVADMKNSVKDRSNAQTSCAGHFIEAHIDESYEGSWLHVDMAGPAMNGQRGTGYGVGLILSLLEAPGF